ncbi:CAP domain-containing protein, partial [Fervidibacter sacchari]
MNAERRERKLPPLSENPILNQSAYLKAKDILDKDYFSHFSPDGLSPWYWFKLSGYDYQFAGENLAIGFLDSKEVHDALMSSPTHKQNILN